MLKKCSLKALYSRVSMASRAFGKEKKEQIHHESNLSLYDHTVYKSTSSAVESQGTSDYDCRLPKGTDILAGAYVLWMEPGNCEPTTILAPWLLQYLAAVPGYSTWRQYPAAVPGGSRYPAADVPTHAFPLL